MWQFLARRAYQVQANTPLLLKTDLLGNVSLFAMLAIRGLFRRKEEATVHECLAAWSDVSEKDASLTVVDLAESAAPLAGDATGVGAFLRESRGVQHENALAIPQLFGDVATQFSQDGVIVPRGRRRRSVAAVGV